MEITREDKPDVVIVKLSGDVDMRSSPHLREELRELTRARAPRIEVSLEGVTYIDSSGIATLIEGLKNAHPYQGRFTLTGVNDNIYPVFELAHLTSVFDIKRAAKGT